AGWRHAKIDKGKAQLIQYRLPPRLIEGEERLFSISFENYASLLPYHRQDHDVIETIDLRRFAAGTIPFVEIAVGRHFLSSPDIHEPDYIERLISETILRTTYTQITT